VLVIGMLLVLALGVTQVALAGPPRRHHAVSHAHPHHARKAKPLVVLDPGHGGKDPGCIGRRGTREKDVVLAIALAARRHIRAAGQFRPVMTRDRDVFVPLRERVALAERHHASLFVSIHANSSPDRTVRGASVYRFGDGIVITPSPERARSRTRAAPLPAPRILGASPETQQILSSLALRGPRSHAARLQSSLVDDIRRVTRVLPDPARYGRFEVLRVPDMPSVLVEIGFLSNPQEERALRDRSQQDRLARAIAAGIGHYLRALHGGDTIHG